MHKKINKKLEVTLAINYIKDVFFQISEPLIFKEKAEEILIQMSGHTGYNFEKNILKFTLRVWYHYKSSDTELAVIEVDNLFNVLDLKKFLTEDNKLNFPPAIWAHIVGLSISHARALFTKNLAGTSLQQVMIPITNPLDVVKEFFPESFEDTNKEPIKEDKPRVKKSGGKIK